MPFQFRDSHISDFYTLGYTVFCSILPPALIRDLRRVAAQAREIIHSEQGQQVQRLQPVAAYDLDSKPFQDFANLSPLRDAVSRVLNPRVRYGNINTLGILLHPGDIPYSTPWHRDWRDNQAGLNLSAWEERSSDIDLFNQMNSPLYEDSSLWVVPSSHLRRDLPGEIERFPDRPIPTPQLEGKTGVEREQVCLDYCRSMPGAVRLHLDTGDFALYRSTLWHLGNYVPYRNRATLHDFVDTPEYRTWREQVTTEAAQRQAAGIEMENPLVS
jgi:hypothetical protein